MARYINLFTDFGFKKIFGSEENKEILLDFLNTLLPEVQTIIDLQYLNSERIGNSTLERKAIYDLYCENDKGEKFIVELQRASQDFFKERSIFYAARAVDQQAEKGEWDYEWKAVYTIAIMNFEFSGMGHDNVVSDVVLYDQLNHLKFSDKLRFIYLEMPKFNKTEEELETNFDKWLYLLKNIGRLDSVPKRLQRILFQRVFQLAEYSNYDKKTRDEYEESLKEYRDYYNTLHSAEKKARQEGLEEGMEKGKIEGENKKAIEIAKKMLLQGLDLSLIQSVTGLTEAEIKKL